MNFRTVKTAIVNLLGVSAAGRYRTIGYQKQAESAEGILDSNRTVQVFYSEGKFPKSAGSLNGPVAHEVTILIQLAVAKSAGCDLSVIEDENSTPAQIAAAIAAMQPAAELADESLDELVDVVYQVLMDAAIDLSLIAPISNKWIESIRKDQPLPRGDLVVLTGEMMLTFRVTEELTGAALTPGQSIDTEVEFDEDETGKAGVDVDTTVS
jgi:hypothetical protein